MQSVTPPKRERHTTTNTFKERQRHIESVTPSKGDTHMQQGTLSKRKMHRISNSFKERERETYN